MNEMERLLSMRDYIYRKCKVAPKISVILGSGLTDVLIDFEEKCKFDFSEIPYFPKTTVPEHVGKFIFGKYNNVEILIMQGRIHFYEGYSMQQVVRPIRLMKLLGVQQVILTNSSGAINENFKVGDIVAINDHIASFVPNPLRDVRNLQFGTQFPDMSNIYSEDLINIIKDAGENVDIQVKEGVYIQTSGPSFESKAEIRMYKSSGADLVGMSTACEAIAAVHAGMKVAGISFVSNMACGIEKNKLSMEDVVKNSLKNRDIYNSFINQIINLLIGSSKYESSDIQC